MSRIVLTYKLTTSSDSSDGSGRQTGTSTNDAKRTPARSKSLGFGAENVLLLLLLVLLSPPLPPPPISTTQFSATLDDHSSPFRRTILLSRSSTLSADRSSPPIHKIDIAHPGGCTLPPSCFKTLESVLKRSNSNSSSFEFESKDLTRTTNLLLRSHAGVTAPISSSNLTLKGLDVLLLLLLSCDVVLLLLSPFPQQQMHVAFPAVFFFFFFFSSSSSSICKKIFFELVVVAIMLEEKMSRVVKPTTCRVPTRTAATEI